MLSGRLCTKLSRASTWEVKVSNWSLSSWVVAGENVGILLTVPSGKHTKNYGKSPCYSWENPLLMAIFNSYVKLPEGTIDSILVIIQYSFFMNTYERNSEVHWSNFLLFLLFHRMMPTCSLWDSWVNSYCWWFCWNFSEHPWIFQSITEIPTKTCFNVAVILIILMYLNSVWRVWTPIFRDTNRMFFQDVGSKNQVTLLTPGDMRWLFCSGFGVPSSFVTMPGFPGCLARFVIERAIFQIVWLIGYWLI